MRPAAFALRLAQRPWDAADQLARTLDLETLTNLGWDSLTSVFTPDPQHPLLGWRVCPVKDCGGEGRQSDGLCTTCAVAFEAEEHSDFATFCTRGVDPKRRRPPGLCLVCRTAGHERPVAHQGLCNSCAHLRRQRGQSVRGYVHGDERYPPARARPSFGHCPARSCQRVGAHLNGLCEAHYQLWRVSGFPILDGFLRSGTPRHGDLKGRVVMAGLPERVIAEVLYGIQVFLADGAKLRPPALRAAVMHLRDAEVPTLMAFDGARLTDPARRFLAATADALKLLGSSPECEFHNDVWDLRIWGHAGKVSFVGGHMLHVATRGQPVRPITQGWLKEATKTWCADALITRSPASARRVIAATGLFSEHLGLRNDAGEVPAAIDRADLEAFLARLGRLEKAGSISRDGRVRIIRTVSQFLRDCRALGLCRPGQPMAGLGDDVFIRRSDVPRLGLADPEDTGRALPEIVLAQLLDEANLERLEAVSGPSMRAAVELQAGVGRRTGELCSLVFNCLDYDEHVDEEGVRRRAPVLVHDMPKVDKVGCRLPITKREEGIILGQQERVRAAFPTTQANALALFPRVSKNPDGTRPIAAQRLSKAMQRWASSLPRLDGPGTDATGRALRFPTDRIVPYAFRHSFAQRHADAGTPVDTLKELMGHKAIHTTLGYYRVTTRRKRAAQEALGPLQLDATARQVRPMLGALSDAEVLRDQVGQVAVPFGICTEPSNVVANGGACPFRHRCLGCEHFRTDPSYQPELRAYLTQLLVDRERLSASAELAPWAQRDAAPAEEEIEAARRLVRTNDEALAVLGDTDRRAIEDAITVLQKERARLDTSFPIELRGVVRQRRPSVFPAIERQARQEAGGD